MSYDLDEDILQDFLVEAGEILELLSEQLVELENNPDDKDLLNAIFRGFHTVKGGAGFLALTELVDTCHGAENVFDILRNGQRSVTSGLMDTMLQALDTVNVQFQAVQDQEPLVPADQALLDELHRLCKPQSTDEAAPVEAPAPVIAEPVFEAPAEPIVESASISASSVDDISEDEFERLLDELHGKGGSPTASSVSTPPPAPVAPQSVAESGDITDDEFEKLLDELHGAGKSPTAVGSAPPPPPAPSSAPVSAMSEGDDLMSDEEFEKLLDQLHGSGNGPTIEELDAATKPAAAKPIAPVPAPQVAPKPKPSAPVAVKEAPAKAEVKVPAKKQQADATVRVDTSTLDTIMNMVVLGKGEEITSDMLPQSMLQVLAKGVAEVQIEQTKIVKSEEALVSQISPNGVNGQMADIRPLWLEEKQIIERAIGICSGNIPKAAALLDVSASTIYRKRQVWEKMA